MTVGIVTDSAASLPADLAASSGVQVVPLWLTLGEDGRPVRDGELGLDEVVRRLDEGLTTSSPSPGEFARAVEQAEQGDGVVLLTLSAEMSSTHDSARLAVQLAEDDRVRLLDTGTAAGAEGLVVLAAAAAAAAGSSVDQVEAAARTAMDSVRLVATLPSLDQLAKGGRVPGAAAWAGRWLDLNPLFEFRGGHVRPLRPARGRHAAHDRLLSLWEHSITADADLHVCALHALDPEAAQHLLDAVHEAGIAPATEFVGSFSPVMVAHTGPELVGLAWWWQPRT